MWFLVAYVLIVALEVGLCGRAGREALGWFFFVALFGLPLGYAAFDSWRRRREPPPIGDEWHEGDPIVREVQP